MSSEDATHHQHIQLTPTSPLLACASVQISHCRTTLWLTTILISFFPMHIRPERTSSRDTVCNGKIVADAQRSRESHGISYVVCICEGRIYQTSVVISTTIPYRTYEEHGRLRGDLTCRSDFCSFDLDDERASIHLS